METQIEEFWNYFLSIQISILDAHCMRDEELGETLFNNLFSKAIAIHPKLEIVFLFSHPKDGFAKLIFLTKGDHRLKEVIVRIIDQAPYSDLWKYQTGIPPYMGTVNSLCKEMTFLNNRTTIFQIYFAVQKIYKTTNKLYLTIYLEMDKSHSKSDLSYAMDTILIFFLGDAFYRKHIGRFRIVRRKYSRIRFIPLDELKHLIQFKTIN